MKVGEKSGNLSQSRLDNFLLGYRSTPHATMQHNPASLILRRDLRTCMDLLKPNCEEQVTMHQGNQTRHHNQHTKSCMLQVSQSDMARNLDSRSKWMPRVVKQIRGPLYYVIEVDNGVEWKWHMDHILPAGSSPHSKGTPGEDLGRSDWLTFLHHRIQRLLRLPVSLLKKSHWKTHFLGI